MKYVMFRNNKTGTLLPVFCSDTFAHADMTAGKGWTPVSAGDYDAVNGITSGYSTSLKMGPAGIDAKLCQLVVAGLESMVHLVQ